MNYNNRDVLQYIEELLARYDLQEGELFLVGPQIFEGLTTNFNFVSTPKSKIEAVIVTALPSDEKPALETLETLKKYECPIVFAVQNTASKKIALELLSGNVDCDLPCSENMLFSQEVLLALTTKSGLFLSESHDLLNSFSEYSPQQENILLADGALAANYLDWLSKMLNNSSDTYYFVRAYAPGAVLPRPEIIKDKPFLTVLTRTQGTRIQELRETILCLSAQDNTDFELLIVGHKVQPEDEASIHRLIEDVPLSFRENIRYVALNSGGRSAPLNKGFEQARGLYVSILDDDDLVMGNWVQSFYDAYTNAPGAILHSYGLAQHWRREETENGTTLLSCLKPTNDFCSSFEYIKQLHMNVCPTMALAFPASIYQKMGIEFDDTLNTTEDWDFLMRAAFIYGVCDIEAVTSIYRLWDNAVSSASLHNSDEWARNRERILLKHTQMPILLPIGYSFKLEEMFRHSNAEPIIIDSRDQVSAVLYGKRPEGFSEDYSFRSANETSLPAFAYTYSTLSFFDFCEILRFDPVEFTDVVVTNFSAVLTDENGQQLTVNPKQITCNGFVRKKQMIFLKPDPQIYIPIPQGFKLSSAAIKGEIGTELSSATVDAVVGISFIRRIWRKLRSIIKS